MLSLFAFCEAALAASFCSTLSVLHLGGCKDLANTLYSANALVHLHALQPFAGVLSRDKAR